MFSWCIWSEAIVSAWPRGARAHDWSDHGRAHVGDTKNRNKHVNCKTCVHQISEISLMNRVWVWSRVATSVRGCVVVDQWCRGSNGKVKIEGYMSISDEEAHHHCHQVSTLNYVLTPMALHPSHGYTQACWHSLPYTEFDSHPQPEHPVDLLAIPINLTAKSHTIHGHKWIYDLIVTTWTPADCQIFV